MQKGKPRVAVFYGGEEGTYPLSRHTGHAVCEALPRSLFNIIPVRITPEGQWQVPLGVLPQEGSINRMVTMLEETVPTVTPAKGLERLLQKPLAALIPLTRGDSGSVQSLAETLNVPVIGSSAATSALTSHKYHAQQLAHDIISTPHSQLYNKQMDIQSHAATIQSEFMFPFFIKLPTHEGSSGVHEVVRSDMLESAMRATSHHSHMAQERIEGDEIAVSIVTDTRGRAMPLAPLVIKAKHSFYDHASKQHPGRVQFTPADVTNPRIANAIEAALELFTFFDCRDYATIDMIMAETGPVLLDINTVPTLSETTPLLSQLREAQMHPSYLFQRLLTQLA